MRLLVVLWTQKRPAEPQRSTLRGFAERRSTYYRATDMCEIPYIGKIDEFHGKIFIRPRSSARTVPIDAASKYKNLKCPDLAWGSRLFCKLRKTSKISKNWVF